MGASEFCRRYYRLLAAAILGLAAFNLAFRLNTEIVNEWDESLYGLSAWEMVQSGNWIATTRNGALDYYNVKPPLNVWLIALSFKTFGASVAALRLPSVVAAWLTVLILQVWTRRYFGRECALLASFVLATTFGFFYVHSGKTADTDALFTLLMLLTVVTLSSAFERPWRLIWLGPILAATFLLRGMAVLMPLLVILVSETLGGRPRRPRLPASGVAAILAAAPIAAWAIARWQVDQGQFLERLFFFDFVARANSVLEGHTGGPLYYLNILQRYQYDWVLAASAALLLFPLSLRRRDAQERSSQPELRMRELIAAWIIVALLIPTIMQTKLPWYLNPFYPVFALGVAAAVVRGLSQDGHRIRRRMLTGILVVVAITAESKLLWHSYYRRDPSRSVQGLLFAEANQLRGRRVCRERWNVAEVFVLEALIRSERRICQDQDAFVRESAPGDYLVAGPDVNVEGLTRVRAEPAGALYRRDR